MNPVEVLRMNAGSTKINSESAGNSEHHLAFAELERGLSALPIAPRDNGRVVLILQRGEHGNREILDRVVVTPADGIPGDAWNRREKKNPESQIAVMQADVAALIANGQPLTLFGDGLILDLDLSVANLPEGSRIALGDAVLEVTPMPHNGCHKFRARFGPAALRFVSEPALRHRNLRGIYLRVVAGGELRTGARAQVLNRGPRDCLG